MTATMATAPAVDSVSALPTARVPFRRPLGIRSRLAPSVLVALGPIDNGRTNAQACQGRARIPAVVSLVVGGQLLLDDIRRRPLTVADVYSRPTGHLALNSGGLSE
jgi:hypothetical protein